MKKKGESEYIAQSRRLKYIQCPICGKAVRSHKLSEHTKKVHQQTLSKTRGRGRGSVGSETLLVCFAHPDPAYLRWDTITETEKKAFVRKHQGHMKPNYILKNRDRTRLDDIFERTFGRDEAIVAVSAPESARSTPSSLARIFESPGTSSFEHLFDSRDRLDRHEVDLDHDADREVIDISDDEDVMIRAAQVSPEEEAFITMTPNIQQQLKSGLPQMDLNQIEEVIERIPSVLETLDPDELDIYITPFNLQREERGFQTEPSVRGRYRTDVGESMATATQQTGLPMTSTQVQSSTSAPQRSLIQSGSNSATIQTQHPIVGQPGERNSPSAASMGTQTQPTQLNSLNEEGATYISQMRALNELTISQLLEDRKQLDQHLHTVRQQMIHRLGELVNDIEHSYAQQQSMPDNDYANRVRFIQERFIQKLASENASILVPLRSLWA